MMNEEWMCALRAQILNSRCAPVGRDHEPALQSEDRRFVILSERSESKDLSGGNDHLSTTGPR